MLLTSKKQDTPLNKEAEILVSKTRYTCWGDLDLFLTRSTDCPSLAIWMPVNHITVFPAVLQSVISDNSFYVVYMLLGDIKFQIP